MSFEQIEISFQNDTDTTKERLKILTEELEWEERQRKRKKKIYPLYGNFWKYNTVYAREPPKSQYWEYILLSDKELWEERQRLMAEFEEMFTYEEGNQDFFDSSYNQKWPGSFFFYTSKTPWEKSLWQKIANFNETASKFWLSKYQININEEVLGKKIQTFLESMNESIIKKLEKGGWRELEQTFIPNYYGMIQERERRKKTTNQINNTDKNEEFLYNREYLIISAIIRERSLFEKAKLLVKYLPEKIKSKITFDFNPVWKRFNFVYKKYLEWIQYSENTLKNTQALFIHWKLANVEDIIEEKMTQLSSTNQSTENIIEQAKRDDFFWFFLKSDKKIVRKAWENMIVWRNRKKGKWIPFWSLSHDESIFYISLIQFQLFWKNQFEIDGKIGKKTFKVLKEKVKFLSIG